MTTTDQPITRPVLAALVTQHDGNLSAIARDLCDAGYAITRQALTRRLRRAKLDGRASLLRFQAGVNGRWVDSPARAVARAALRRQMIRALASEQTIAAAAASLGTPLRTFYRHIKQLGINRTEWRK